MEPMVLSAREQNTLREQTLMGAVRQYGQRLFRFIRGRVETDEDAEDILQDVWFQFANQPEAELIDSVSGWLHRVARNRIVDTARKKRPERLEDFAREDEDGNFSLPEFLLGQAATAEDEFFRQMFWEELNAALDELPEHQRYVFIQNELEGRTLQQIADETQANLKTVISRKNYAVKHLRKRLEALYRDLENN